MNRHDNPWNRRAMAVSTVAIALLLTAAAAAYACSNYVGVMKVFGNVSTQSTVTVTGSESYGEGIQAMTQSVSAAFAYADNESTGQFQMWTGPETQGWKLGADTYNVHWLNDGYTDHTHWGPQPAGECMSTNELAVLLGTVTINSSGNISGGSGSFFISYANNWAKFDLPTAVANTNGHESAVCLNDTGDINGNVVPLKLV